MPQDPKLASNKIARKLIKQKPKVNNNFNIRVINCYKILKNNLPILMRKRCVLFNYIQSI